MLVGVLVVVAAGFWLLTGRWPALTGQRVTDEGVLPPHAESTERVPDSPSQRPEATPPQAAAAQPQPLHPSRTPSDLVNAISSAGDARQALNLLHELERLDPAKAADLRYAITQYCAPFRMPGDRKSRLASHQWTLDQMAELCAGYSESASMEQLEAAALTSGYSAAIAQRLHDLAAASGPVEAVAQAESLAIASRDRLELEVAVDLLTSGDALGPWAFGSDDEHLAANPADARVTQFIALSIYGCQVFPDCGPRSARTLLVCSVTQSCQPGYAYVDYLRANHPPVRFNAAARLAQRLLHRRASGP